MNVNELQKTKSLTNENITEYSTGKLVVRLINTYGDSVTFDDILYNIICNKMKSRTV